MSRGQAPRACTRRSSSRGQALRGLHPLRSKRGGHQVGGDYMQALFAVIPIRCHSEERSDEESLAALGMTGVSLSFQGATCFSLSFRGAKRRGIPRFSRKGSFGARDDIRTGGTTGAVYTPHVPPNPIVTLPASTMTGTRRPPERRTIRSSS